ncbi:MAG TPA: alanine-zipper protein [Gammaproteobacteria bacterium]|nr:alanine-zipper protein [Gammaproteobacteria bacterium]
MSTFVRCFAFFAAALPASLALAQEPIRPRTPTLEERVTALESSIATLDTRFGLARSRPGDDAGQTELALSGRIQALERTVDRLSVDLQRVQRTADDALRAAGAAQRTAEQAARDAQR